MSDAAISTGRPTEVLKCLVTYKGDIRCGKGKGWDDLDLPLSPPNFLMQTVPFVDSYVALGRLPATTVSPPVSLGNSYSEMLLNEKKGLRFVGMSETTDLQGMRDYEFGFGGMGVNMGRGLILILGGGCYKGHETQDMGQAGNCLAPMIFLGTRQ